MLTKIKKEDIIDPSVIKELKLITDKLREIIDLVDMAKEAIDNLKL